MTLIRGGHFSIEIHHKLWYIIQMKYEHIKTTLPLNVNYSNVVTKWYSIDDEESFRRNKQKFGDKFEWTETDITYHMNSNGCRYDEFDTVDFSNSYIIVGCSHVMGVGQRFEDTIGEQLSKKLGKRVINIGAVGAGNEVIFYNTLWANSLNPLGIITLWSHTNRIFFYRNDGEFDFISHYNYNESEIKNYIKEDYVLQSSDLYMKTELYKQILIQYNKVQHFNFFDYGHNDYRPIYDWDLARDMMHKGKDYNRQVADIIYKEMTK